ncbi:MAG: amidohydrolase family protein [Pseudomonadota bacterium]
MNRRRFILMAGTGVAAAAIWNKWPEQGFFNACLVNLPPEIAQHDLVRAAWDGIDAKQVWDCHVHLVGVGDRDSGAWTNPKLDSLWHPIQRLQKLFYLNAGCVHEAPGRLDQSYIERLHNLVDGMRPGAKLMLLAFDRNVRTDGKPDWGSSTFYTPNSYARDMARQHPQYFEWIASIHPYRVDAIKALEQAVQDGARAVKWLPNAMNIDPASARCDAFYALMAKHDLPLLTHAGKERAVSGGEAQDYGNPLKMRRALDHGVRVIMAHCASLGDDRDLDQGAQGPSVPSFDLFARLMREPRYEGRLFGDISALTQFDRAEYLKRVLATPAWHHRLLNGSDYPLPGILPIYSATTFVELGLLEQAAVPVLNAIQQHNPLLFDFVLKRSLRLNGAGLPARIFETRSFFERSRHVLSPAP